MNPQDILDEQSRASANRSFEEWDVTNFMNDLATCTNRPSEFMKDHGCDELPDYVADLLQSMALTCVAGHGLNMPGSDRFWQAMKQLAMQKFDFDRS